jgi:hypothetical protein
MAGIPKETEPSLGRSSNPSKKFVVVGAWIGSAIAIAVGAWWFGASVKHRDGAETTPREIAQSPSAIAALSGAPRAKANATEILVSLSATPTTAILLLDGRRISNPYRAAHGSDGTLHHLSVSLEGYETVEKELLFDRSIEANFALAPTPSATPQKKDAAVTKRTSQGASATAKARGGFETGANTLPVGAVPQPGEDLRGTLSRSKPRDIEETDPYKR